MLLHKYQENNIRIDGYYKEETEIC